MMNLNLKKLLATLGITALALTAVNAVSLPANTLAGTETAITVSADTIKEEHFSINATNGETFVNVGYPRFTVDDNYICMVSLDNGKTWEAHGYALRSGITKTTTMKVKCVKNSNNDKTFNKRLAKAKVYTYKFNVINTGVSVDTIDADTVADGMDVYADSADITLGYPGKAITYGKYDSLGFYKAKGKVFDDMDRKTVKTSTKKYDKNYAKLTAQTLYYTLDGSTPTTKSAKVSAGKLKTITVETPGTHTLKVMGAKEKKVYTYTFYVDTVTATTVDVPEANVYACSDDGLRSFYVTPQNVSITAYKYFKTSVTVKVYQEATKGSEREEITLEADTTMEIPYNYFEGKGIQYAYHNVAK